MPHMLLLWWLLVLLWWLQVKRLLRRSAVVIAQTPSLRQTAQLELILHSWKHVSEECMVVVYCSQRASVWYSPRAQACWAPCHVCCTAVCKHRGYMCSMHARKRNDSMYSMSLRVCGTVT